MGRQRHRDSTGSGLRADLRLALKEAEVPEPAQAHRIRANLGRTSGRRRARRVGGARDRRVRCEIIAIIATPEFEKS